MTFTLFICVLRTLFYQFFFLFVAFAVGFLLNAEYAGWKSTLVLNSYNNIFYPVDFNDPGVLDWLYNQGRFKIWSYNRHPADFEIVEEAMMAEEWYWVKYSYTDENGDKQTAIDHTRIRWKPWEYYYEDESLEPMTQEEMVQYINEGTLNSRETDRATRLRDEYRDQERKKEIK